MKSPALAALLQVLIGAIGLYPNPGERAPTRITTLLDQAAHAEELIGGLVEAR